MISPASAGLQQAPDLLYENFGQKHIVVDTHLNSICKGPPVKPDQESLRKLATELTNCQIVMKAWGFGSLHNSPQTLESVFKRLLFHLQKLFCNKVEINTNGHLATFEELTCFVKQAVQCSNTFFGKIVANSMATRRSRQEKQQIPSGVFTSQFAATSEISNYTVTTDRTACGTCGGNHPLCKCDNFHKLPVPQRWSRVKSQRKCFNCLGRGHMSRECNKSHHSLLHNGNSSNSRCSKTPSDLKSCATTQSLSAQVNYVSPITVPSQIKMVRLMVAPVQVYSNDQTHFVDTYAFLDGGSNISLCTTSLTQRLKLRGSRVTRKIEGVTGSKYQQGYVVTVKIKGLQETELISVD